MEALGKCLGGLKGYSPLAKPSPVHLLLDCLLLDCLLLDCLLLEYLLLARSKQ